MFIHICIYSNKLFVLYLVENDIEEMKKYMEDVVSSLNRTFIRQKNLVKKVYFKTILS